MTTSAQPRYGLGDSPPEVDHLLAQAEFLAPHAAGLLACIGVAPGASVIDIGCPAPPASRLPVRYRAVPGLGAGARVPFGASSALCAPVSAAWTPSMARRSG
jgi:hypothetical protein